MSPWVPIAVSVATAVILGLLAVIWRRETNAIATKNTETAAALAKLELGLSTATRDLREEVRRLKEDADKKYLPRDLFDRLEQARKEVEEARRDTEKRLGDDINRLLERLGGGRGKDGHR